MLKLTLQYLWIEKWKNLENIGLNFSNQFSFNYNGEGILEYTDNSENYVSDVFGENTDLTVVVGNNGAGKTSLFELIMYILNGNAIPTNSIVVFCSDNNLLVAYHTGIVKSFRDKNIIMEKGSDGRYTLPDEVRIPSIYYTDVFNYEQYDQEYNNIYNLSRAYMFKKLSFIIEDSDKKKRRVTDIFEYHSQVINNQLSFIYNYGEFFESFGIRRPKKFYIYFKEKSNGLSELFKEYEINKKEAKKQVEIKSKISHQASAVYKSYVEECDKLETEINIKQLCENFIPHNSTKGIESFAEKIAIGLINCFLSELQIFNTWFFNIMDGSSKSFSFLRYINKIYSESKEDSSQLAALNRIKLFFEKIDDYAKEADIFFLKSPALTEEKWEFFDTDKYKKFVNFILDFIDKSKKNVDWNLDNQICINIDNDDKSNIDAISFYNEYARIGKISNFLSFSYGLSSGEMALLNMYSGIFRIINDIKAEIKSSGKSNNAILLIDEADMLLHPEWQQKYIDSLINFLMSVAEGLHLQVIIATHSPIMLSDIPKQNVLYLTEKTESLPSETFSANIFQLFRYSFFLDESAIGTFAEKKLKNIIHRIDTIDKKNGIILDREVELIQKEIKLIGDPFLRKKFEDRYYTKLSNIRELSNENKIKVLQKQVDELQNQIAEMKKKDNSDE